MKASDRQRATAKTQQKPRIQVLGKTSPLPDRTKLVPTKAKASKRVKWDGAQRITKFYESMGLKRRAFVDAIGYTYDRVIAYELGRTEPSPEFFQAISKQFPEADLHWLLTGTRGSGMRIPILSHIRAGKLTMPLDDENIVGWWEGLRSKDQDLFALIVRGNSMFPEVQEEDIALCAPHQTYLNGKIYAVSTHELESTVKRVFKRKDGYDLVPSNQEYPTTFVHASEVLRLIRVIEIVRPLT